MVPMNQRRSKRHSRGNIERMIEKSESSETKTSVRIEEELQRAMGSVLATRDRAKKLHLLWRNHLWKLSFLVSFLSMYQTQEPFKICISNVKNRDDSLQIQSLLDVIGGNLCEVVNMIISTLLFYFLSLENPNGSLSLWPFMTASSLVPVCLGLFYNSTPIGCLNASTLTREDELRRHFPVSVIFHVIVAGCYWFMKIGMDQYENNIDMVQKLQTELSISTKRPAS